MRTFAEGHPPIVCRVPAVVWLSGAVSADLTLPTCLLDPFLSLVASS